MPTSIKYTEELREAFDDEACEEVGFLLVVEGDWRSDGKYQHVEHIYQHIESSKFYRYQGSRSGSYHTDWDYNEPDELIEVEPVQITKTIYKVVK